MYRSLGSMQRESEQPSRITPLPESSANLTAHLFNNSTPSTSIASLDGSRLDMSVLWTTESGNLTGMYPTQRGRRIALVVRQLIRPYALSFEQIRSLRFFDFGITHTLDLSSGDVKSSLPCSLLVPSFVPSIHLGSSTQAL